MRMNTSNKQGVTNNKCIRFPDDLMKKIQKSAEKETRTFSAQVIHIIKKYYEMQESEK